MARGKKIAVDVNTDPIVQENSGKRKKTTGRKGRCNVILKGDYQEYARVLRTLGDGLCEAMCFDTVKRLCYIEGDLLIAAGDIILVSPHNYEDDKAFDEYLPDEIRLLKDFDELPKELGSMMSRTMVCADDYMEFQDEDIDMI